MFSFSVCHSFIFLVSLCCLCNWPYSSCARLLITKIRLIIIYHILRDTLPCCRHSVFTFHVSRNVISHNQHFVPWHCLCQWPRGLRRMFAAARLLRSWVRILPRAWSYVCCECCMLSSRGLCDELITRPEGSYQLWCVVVRGLETTWMKRPWPALGRSAKRKTMDKMTFVSILFREIQLFFY